MFLCISNWKRKIPRPQKNEKYMQMESFQKRCSEKSKLACAFTHFLPSNFKENERLKDPYFPSIKTSRDNSHQIKGC